MSWLAGDFAVWHAKLNAPLMLVTEARVTGFRAVIQISGDDEPYCLLVNHKHMM
jgi:hypothetical protein